MKPTFADPTVFIGTHQNAIESSAIATIPVYLVPLVPQLATQWTLWYPTSLVSHYIHKRISKNGFYVKFCLSVGVHTSLWGWSQGHNYRQCSVVPLVLMERTAPPPTMCWLKNRPLQVIQITTSDIHICSRYHDKFKMEPIAIHILEKENPSLSCFLSKIVIREIWQNDMLVHKSK